MKPLNRSERNRAFWQFLLLFLMTTGLIVAGIFFSIEVPRKENDALRQQITDIQNKKRLTEPFYVAMKEAMDVMHRFNTPNVSVANIKSIEQQVDYSIDRMERLLKDFPDSGNSVYPLIVQNISELNKAKARLSLNNQH